MSVGTIDVDVTIQESGLLELYLTTASGSYQEHYLDVTPEKAGDCVGSLIRCLVDSMK